MPATVEEVKKLIQEAFPDSVADIGERNHRVTGTIIWKPFRDIDAEDRNKLVTEKVRNKLDYRGTNIGFLLPLASKDEV